jgi:hypothetical protein
MSVKLYPVLKVIKLDAEVSLVAVALTESVHDVLYEDRVCVSELEYTTRLLKYDVTVAFDGVEDDTSPKLSDE